MNAVPYSDDINKGYEIVKKHLKDIGLWNRIYEKYSIDPLTEHHLFENHYGGVEFDVKIKDVDTRWHIVYTTKDLFNVLTETQNSNQILWDFSYDDLIALLYAVVVELKKEEDRLLGKAIRESEYRKVAKRMHYYNDGNSTF